MAKEEATYMPLAPRSVYDLYIPTGDNKFNTFALETGDSAYDYHFIENEEEYEAAKETATYVGKLQAKSIEDFVNDNYVLLEEELKN